MYPLKMKKNNNGFLLLLTLVVAFAFSCNDLGEFYDLARPPELISPANESLILEEEVEFVWEPLYGAQEYLLYYNDEVIYTRGSPGSMEEYLRYTHTIPVTANAEHTWSVLAKSQFQTVQSEQYLFYTNQDSPFIHISSPVNDEIVSGTITINGYSSLDELEIDEISLVVNSTTDLTINGTENWNAICDTTLFPDGETIIIAKLTDAQGNISTSTLKIIIDNTNPTISFVNPTDGEWRGSRFTIQGEALDNIGLNSVQISIDGVDWVNTNGLPTDWSYTLKSDLSNGLHSISARATDRSGLTAEESIDIQVDDTAPNINITSHTQGPYPPATPDSVSQMVTITGTASDPDSGINTVQIKLGEEAYTTCNPTGVSPDIWATWDYTFDSSSYSDGYYYLTAQSINNAGTTSENEIIVRITNYPTIQISNPLDNAKLSASSLYCNGDCTIEGQSGAPSGSSNTITNVEIRFKENAGVWGGWNPVSNPDTGSDLSNWQHLLDSTIYEDGTLYIEIRATNSLAFTTTKSLIVSIDNHNPSITLTNPAGGETLDTIYLIEGTASDNVLIPPGGSGQITAVNVFLDGTFIGNAITHNDFADWQFPLNVATYSNGDHSITVMALDWFGFVSTGISRTVTFSSGVTLLAHYPFDGDAQDISGNDYHGTMYGGIAEDQNRFGDDGKTLYFDGVDDQIEIDPAIMDGLDSVSFSYWIKTTDDYFCPLTAANSGTDNEYLIEDDGGRLVVIINGSKYTLTNDRYNDGFWHHIVITSTPTDSTLYIDGVLVNTRPDGIAPPIVVEGLWLACDQDSVGGGFTPTQFLDGNMDDFRIYEGELTLPEVQILYNLVE